jgi:hypothetical protein
LPVIFYQAALEIFERFRFLVVAVLVIPNQFCRLAAIMGRFCRCGNEHGAELLPGGRDGDYEQWYYIKLFINDSVYETISDAELIASLRTEGKAYCLALSRLRGRIDKKTFSASDELYAFYKNFSGYEETLDDIKKLLVQAKDTRVIPALLEEYDRYDRYGSLTTAYLIKRTDERVFNVIDHLSDFEDPGYSYHGDIRGFAKILSPYYEGREDIVTRCINALNENSFPMLLSVARGDLLFIERAPTVPEWENALRFGRGAARFNAALALASYSAGQKLLGDYLFQTTDAELFLLIASKVSVSAGEKSYARLKEFFLQWTKRRYSGAQSDAADRIVELLFITRYPDTAGVIKSDENYAYYHREVTTIREKLIQSEGLEKALDIFAANPPVTDAQYYRRNYPEAVH